MKLLKYIAVLAVLSLSGLAYAQTAPELGSDGLAVTTSLENGIVKIGIKMYVTNPTASSEDAIKKAVAEALKASGTNTNYAKAITASIAAIKAAVKDVNYPAKGTVSLNISLKNTVFESNPAIEANTVLSVGGKTYDSQTRSVFMPDGSVKTEGNISVDNSTTPVVVTTDPAGKITGFAGKSVVDDTTAERAIADNLTVSPYDNEDSPQSAIMDNVIPDNTIVSTETR